MNVLNFDAQLRLMNLLTNYRRVQEEKLNYKLLCGVSRSQHLCVTDF